MNTSLVCLSRRSGTLALLTAIFAVACALGYLVVRHAVTNTVEHQAVTIAEIVASQAKTARSVYAVEVAEKLRKDGFGPNVNSASMPGHVPIPAQFLKLVGQATSANSDGLYAYKPVSKWNLEPTQGLTDDFLRWAWPQLEQQDTSQAHEPLAWKPVYRFEDAQGQRVLRYLAADPAARTSCVQCHNAYEQMPEVVARRVAAGTEPHKQWQLNQLMGAISISIPLDRAELMAGAQIKQTSIFVFAILVLSFLSLNWFNWRLAKKEISLKETETQLVKSELETQTANELLVAKQGVEQALAELSTYLQAIDHHAIVSVSDKDGRIIHVNDKFVEVSGYQRDELIGQDHHIINSGVHPLGFFAGMWATLAQGEIWRGMVCNRAKSGDLYWVDSAIVPLKDAEGEVVRYISIRIDVTDHKRAEEAITHMATHDPLTGLANRSLLLNKVRMAVEHDRRRHEPSAVLFIDLDHFKAINDSLGHNVGDQLLIEVAQRLMANTRAGDTVARQGGDEFIVFLAQITETHDVQMLADKLLRALTMPYQVQDHVLHIGASIGVALFPQDGLDVETLLKNSDAAMYKVKESGRNHVLFFTPSMNEQAAARYTLLQDLRRALSQGELSLVYQPIVGVEHGNIEALEVLLRWQHPTQGPLPPAEFIPLAESSGLIVEMGEWVLRTACLQWVQWRAAGLRVPRLAINLSAIQFHNKHVVDMVKAVLADTGVEASHLELEIAESSLMNQSAEVVGTLEQLSDMGLQMSIDDFGTGYSSLSYLKRFPIDTLKIDRSFVQDIEQDPDDAAIVSTVIAMAHGLKMNVVAEGVETEGQLAFLRERGCDHFQGYLFSRPLPAPAIEALLRTSS